MKQNNKRRSKLPSSRIFQVYIAPLSPSFPPEEQKAMVRGNNKFPMGREFLRPLYIHRTKKERDYDEKVIRLNEFVR